MILKPANILTCILICLCIYGGSGFYLGQYCCNDCRDSGVEAVLSGECHKIHEADESTCCSGHSEKKGHEQTDECSGNHYDHRNCCSVTSYKFDAISGVYKAEINVPVLDLPYPLQLHILNTEIFTLSLNDNLTDYILPTYSPGDILILHSTFLI